MSTAPLLSFAALLWHSCRLDSCCTIVGNILSQLVTDVCHLRGNSEAHALHVVHLCEKANHIV
eukprot:2583291-Prorocentrum_lima.AAC.1